MSIHPVHRKTTFVIPLLLALIVLTGGALRLFNPLWDLATFPHPDERSTLLFYAPTIHFPQDLSDTLNPKKSPLNPFWDAGNQSRRSYTYGHFPLYLLVFVSDTLHNLTPIAESLSLPPTVTGFLRAAESGRGFAVTGRVLVGLFDTLSIYLAFLIARKLYGDWAGLLAGGLYAFAVTPIQLAHFFAVDPVSTTFVLLTIYAAILMLERRTPSTAILAGVAIGLAVASKYSALPVALVPAVAVYFINRDEHHPLADWLFHPLLWTAAVTSFITFAVTSPFVLLDFQNFYTAVVKEQGQMVSGAADFPFTRQYRNTPAYWYFLDQQLRWGMGWALGVLALAGTAWTLGRGVMGKLSRWEWLPLAWFIPYFGLTGLFLAKFMRYMSPVIPLMVIFGVGLVAALVRRWRTQTIALSAVVLAMTALWAAMFVNGVYGTEHSWVTASRWIYANVPDDSCIAVEHWEEGVPRDFAWAEAGASPGLHGYRQPQLPMYDPDTEQKFITIRDTLNSCDYLVIASNRMSRTLPRLSVRYPMSTQYYAALFAGKLGYEPVATFETPPVLFGFKIDDQPADESFTVYDHPKATIFKKVKQLSNNEWWAVLGESWEGAQHGYTGKPTLLMKLRGADTPSPARLGDEKSTALKNPLSARVEVDDFRWNTLATQNPAVAIAVWWLAVQVIGLLAFPITFTLLKNLAGGGWLLSKSLGLLLVSYGVWLLASFSLPANRLGVIWAMMAVLGAVSFTVWQRNRAAIKLAVREKRVFIAVGEGVFAGVFLLFVAYRLANPDLWQPWNGGEKMLEIGFLNAIVKSATMPPYDPFFAGTVLNYYYYGLFLVGVLVKLTGIIPTTAFNLAVPLVAAFTAVNVFALAGSLAFNLKPEARNSKLTAIGIGLLAVLMVVFFSNLDGMGQFLRNLADASGSNFSSAIPGLETLVRGMVGFGKAMAGTPIREYNYWDVSRVIPATINEFPYWSFLFADLHPHMIGIPFTILFLGILFGQFQVQGSKLKVSAAQAAGAPAYITHHASLFIAFVLGALAVINTWDMPTYLGLAVAAFGLTRIRAGRGVWHTVGETALFGGAVLVGAMILYRPFFANYQPLNVGLGVVKDKIPLDQLFKLWGFFGLVIFTWLWLELRQPRTRFAPLRFISLGLRRWNVLPHLQEMVHARVSPSPTVKNVLTALWLALGTAAVLVLFRFNSIAVILPALAVALLLLFRRETSPAQAFVELLMFTGLLLLLGVQFVFLRDFLGGGDYYRMNTYFKFFIQVWTLFGIAAAVTLPVLWARAARWHWGWRLAWRGTVAVMVFSSLVFFVLGTRARLNNRFPGTQPPRNTLDGMAYMTVGQFSWDNSTFRLAYDYDALKWMQENIHGTPIIAEAKIGYYREWGMRVAAYTGLPSALGGLHQSEQHFPQELGRRDGLVNQFWMTTDPGRTLDLMDELGIEYVYFGQIEWTLYGAQSQARFETLVQSGDMEVVYRNERTVIYRRVKTG